MRRIAVDSVTHNCYRLIREDILSGRLTRGQRLDVPALSREFGVSRSPLMDAVARLAHEGLVVVEARRGSYVARPSARDVREVVQVRVGLELLALELAFPSIDDESLARIEALLPILGRTDEPLSQAAFLESDRRFHEMLVTLAGNSRLTAMVDTISAQVDLFRVELVTPEAAVRAIGAHRSILEALRRRDLQAAQALLRAHIESTGRRALERLQADVSKDQPSSYSGSRYCSIRAPKGHLPGALDTRLNEYVDRGNNELTAIEYGEKPYTEAALADIEKKLQEIADLPRP